MTAASNSPIEQLTALTERLTQLIAGQAKSFETRRPQDAAASMEEVGRLANTYRQVSQQVRAMAKPFPDATPAQRARLLRATEAFDAVLARQGRALEAAKTVSEGLVRAIAEEVARQRTQNSGYGPKGSAGRPGAATAVTLNRRA